MLKKLTFAALLLVSGAASALPAPEFPFDVTFIAESLDGKPFAAVQRPTFRIERSLRLSGKTGCNSYGATVQIEGDMLKLGPVMMTRMACFGAADANERMFTPALSGVQSWQWQNRQLHLLTDKGALLLRRR